MANSNAAIKMMRDFGKRLKAARITGGFETGDEFANLIGIDGPRYRKYERGESLPPLDILALICAHLGQPLDFLVLGQRSSRKPD